MSILEVENPFLQDNLASEPVAGSGFINFLQTIVIALAIVVVLYLFIITPNEVKGESMRETFQNKDILLTNKLIQIFGGKNSPFFNIFGDYQRGDVITFHVSTPTEDDDLIKRIIATAGDRVKVQGGLVYVNDIQIQENYLADGTYKNTTPGISSQTVNNKGKTSLPSNSTLKEGINLTVPDGYYFVMGDNRNNSRDSRFSDIGLVSRNNVKGRVFFRIFPLEQMKPIISPTY